MVKVTWKKLADKRFEFRFLGHAGYSAKGKDIVCAAVSVLFINTMNSIEEFTEDKPVVDINKDEVKAVLDITTKETELLINSMMLGLKQIQEEYGKEYITVFQEEV